MFALYITDFENAKALIFDASGSQIYLATITFATPSSISLKNVLPKLDMNNALVGVFISDSVFYVATNSYNFYKDQSLAS